MPCLVGGECALYVAAPHGQAGHGDEGRQGSAGEGPADAETFDDRRQAEPTPNDAPSGRVTTQVNQDKKASFQPNMRLPIRGLANSTANIAPVAR